MVVFRCRFLVDRLSSLHSKCCLHCSGLLPEDRSQAANNSETETNPTGECPLLNVLSLSVWETRVRMYKCVLFTFKLGLKFDEGLNLTLFSLPPSLTAFQYILFSKQGTLEVLEENLVSFFNAQPRSVYTTNLASR